MTKEELYYYFNLNIEIEQLKERIAWLQSQTEKCTQNISNHCKGSQKKDTIIELMTLKKMLSQRLRECIKQRIRIENYIESIDDFEIRLIMVSRIIKGNSWRKVAFDIGHYDESYPRKKFNQFFKLSEKSE